MNSFFLFRFWLELTNLFLTYHILKMVAFLVEVRNAYVIFFFRDKPDEKLY